MKGNISFFAFKKSFGDQNYIIEDPNYREKILNHPLVQGLWTIGPSFSIIVNTHSWNFELVTGDCKRISGYSCQEIMDMQGKFVLEFPVEEHGQVNLAAVKLGMEYIASRPVIERQKIFVVYFYYAISRAGQLLTIQHQSIPLVFDENNIPFIFCNIYSDISYLKPANIPLGLVINRHINESFEVDSVKTELVRSSDLFSEREKDVIRLLIRGLNSSQIADSLYISPQTVRTHRKNILKKAGLNGTGQLIHYCLFKGVV
jgi:DNA-binding CsgD family transcriptional regulator